MADGVFTEPTLAEWLRDLPANTRYRLWQHPNHGHADKMFRWSFFCHPGIHPRSGAGRTLPRYAADCLDKGGRDPRLIAVNTQALSKLAQVIWSRYIPIRAVLFTKDRADEASCRAALDPPKKNQSMNYRRLGRMNWQVSEVGYGMWGMAGWTGSDLEEVNRALRRAVALGCNFFDTAWGYGAGKSEGILGDLVRDCPDQKLYTATKVPPKNWQWPSRREFSVEDCFPPEHIEEYVSSSLKNSGLAAFDLMQLHTWEDSWLKDDRWYHKFCDLKSQGLFHAIGISQNRWEPWNGVAAVNSGLVDCVQAIYNIFDQNPQDELFPACRQHDVGVIARVPFDEGTLTGTLTKSSKWPKEDWRSSYFVPENLNASVDRAEALRPLIPAGMTMPEMALRFTLSEPTVGTVIPGMRSVRNVDSNMAASEAGPLPTALLQKLAQHRWVRQPTEWSQ